VKPSLLRDRSIIGQMVTGLAAALSCADALAQAYQPSLSRSLCLVDALSQARLAAIEEG
jgi:hypothetical protein